jgi:hypothetical protein
VPGFPRSIRKALRADNRSAFANVEQFRRCAVRGETGHTIVPGDEKVFRQFGKIMGDGVVTLRRPPDQ